MNHLNEIASFVAVVRHGGFTLAAKELNEPKSTLSRKVSQLEIRLGASLLIRTTRSIRLTDAGQKFYDQCSRILIEIEEAEKQLDSHQKKAVGRVKISAPVEVGTHLLPKIITELADLYPEIQIQLDLSDRYVDLFREGFDLAIRAGELKDSSYKAKKLGLSFFSLFASPAYIKKYGRPKAPKDMREHHCIIFSPEFREFPWIVTNKGKKEKLILTSRLQVNSLSMAKNLAVAGAGICYVPNHIVSTCLGNNELVPVLSDWIGDLRPYYLVYPPVKIQPLRTRLVMDFIAEHLSF